MTKTLEKIFEDENYLVINKPAGLLVHGSEQIKEKTLTDMLITDYPDLVKVGDDPSRPGIIHRLDRLASGLLVIAKSQRSFDDLKNQFQKRTIKKLYIALAHGRISKDEGEINFPIERSTKGYKMAALPLTCNSEKNIKGHRADTYFCITKRFKNYTLLEIKIKTGRTHQVRVHLSAYGYPLVGDEVYGTRKTRIKNKKLGINRLFLVANELEFIDLAGNVKSFKVDLPEDLKELLVKIK